MNLIGGERQQYLARTAQLAKPGKDQADCLLETQVWIDQKTRAVVRASGKSPSMGGAQVTAELTGHDQPAAAAPAKPKAGAAAKKRKQ